MANKPKTFATVVSLAGAVDPSLAKAVQSAGKALDGINLKAVALAAAGVAAFAATGKAVVDFGKSVAKVAAKAVESFGELEQNLGGSEAVFGEYAKSIQSLGEDAYKNLGVSQSDYLATANKMGALFQGTGVEQERSLELTEKAIQRAADMASVMGIDTQLALDSIAGAAKGNFTMMDNLGVAMNATAIDAYAASKGVEGFYKKASMSEKAEVAMQMFFETTEQYAGNFAKESTQTISGSIGMLKASVDSVWAGLGNADADIENLAGNVMDAFISVVDNIFPVVKNVFKSLPKVVVTAFDGIKDVLPELKDIALDLLDSLFELILPGVPEMSGLFDGLISALEGVLPPVMSLVTTLLQKLLPPVMRIINAVLPAIMHLLEKLSPIFEAVISAVAPVWDIFASVFEGILDVVMPIVDRIIGIFQGIIDFVKNIFAGNWEDAWLNVVGIFSNVFNGIVDLLKLPFNLIIKGINAFIGGINKIKIPDWVPGIGGKGINIPLIPLLAGGGFTEGLSIAGEAGTEAVISFDRGVRGDNIDYWARAGEMLGVFDSRLGAFPALASAFNQTSAHSAAAPGEDWRYIGETVFVETAGGDWAGLKPAPAGGVEIVIEAGAFAFSPRITLNGGAGKDDVIRALEEEEPRFFDLLEDFLERRGAGAYAGGW